MVTFRLPSARRMKRYRDAIDAFRKGLELEPSNTVMKEGLEEAIREDRILRGIDDDGRNASSSSSRGTSSSRAAPAPSGDLKSFLWGTKEAKFNTVQFGLRIFMLLNFLGYLLTPVFGVYYGELCFSRFMKASLVNYVLYLAWKHGRPQLNQQYAMQLAMDPTSHYVFFCIIFLGSHSYLFAFFPILIGDVVHLAYFSSQLLQRSQPRITRKLATQVNPLMVRVTGRTDWPNLDEKGKWTAIYNRVPQLSANSELSLGMILLVQLLLPSRNFFVCLLYWQFLRLRYMLSNEIKVAFSLLNTRIMRLISHPSCPAVVRTVYGKVQTFCGGMVKVPDANSQQQAAAPRCTIM